jgi:drug/metabolite transporter superfamily protein YnfA
VVAGWVGDLDFGQRHVQMHQVEERVYGCKLVAVLEAEAKVLGNRTAAGGRARQIVHIHHVEVEERVKQLEQSSAFAMEELETRIYRIPVLVVRAMLIVHKTAAGVEQRMAVVGGIRLVKAHNWAAVVGVAEPGKTDASGKKVEGAVVGIAGIVAAAELEAAR